MRGWHQPVVTGARRPVNAGGGRCPIAVSILSKGLRDNHGNAVASDLGKSRGHLTPVAGAMPDADNSDDLSGGVDPIDNEIWPDRDQLPCTLS